MACTRRTMTRGAPSPSVRDAPPERIGSRRCRGRGLQRRPRPRHRRSDGPVFDDGRIPSEHGSEVEGVHLHACCVGEDVVGAPVHVGNLDVGGAATARRCRQFELVRDLVADEGHDAVVEIRRRIFADRSPRGTAWPCPSTGSMMFTSSLMWQPGSIGQQNAPPGDSLAAQLFRTGTPHVASRASGPRAEGFRTAPDETPAGCAGARRALRCNSAGSMLA